MNCAAVNIPGPTSASTGPSGPKGYQHFTTITATSDEEVSAAPTKPSNRLLCTCKDPTNISTCDCVYPGTMHVDNKLFHRDERLDPPTSFFACPMMLVADDGKSRLTPMTDAELKYPEPGPEAVTGDGEYPLRLSEGDCSGLDC